MLPEQSRGLADWRALQAQCKDRASPQLAGRRESPTHCIRQPLADRETESRAIGDGALRPDLDERQENGVELVGRDAAARVGDTDCDGVGLHLRGEAYAPS